MTVHSTLESAINDLFFSRIVIGHRIIAPGDEHALMPQELPAFASSVKKVQRASGAARITARKLLRGLGHPPCALPKLPSGATDWPAGVVGSLAHDSHIAVAALGLSSNVSALGIDIEPAELLPPELLYIVATPQERLRIDDDPYRGRLLFAVKEAVYKAVYPLDGVFLEHHDVQVDLAERKATTRYGRTVKFKFCVSSHLVVVVFVPVAPFVEM
jgi:4'-phosphopantetheinyl transferase EntD